MRKKIFIALSLVAVALAVLVSTVLISGGTPSLHVGTTLDNPTIYFMARSEAYQKERHMFIRHSVIGRDDYFVCRTEYWLRTNHVIAWRFHTYRFDANDTVASSSVIWKWRGLTNRCSQRYEDFRAFTLFSPWLFSEAHGLRAGRDQRAVAAISRMGRLSGRRISH